MREQTACVSSLVYAEKKYERKKSSQKMLENAKDGKPEVKRRKKQE